METKLYSLEDVSKNDGKNESRIWIVIKDDVCDVTDYLDEHPGGKELILEWAGKDCTKAFHDAGHSSDARKEMKRHKIGELRPEDRKQKAKKTEEAKDKSDGRSFCSYLTCGLCT